ncbi:helix-turn-helix domain-containing protein [Sphingomonas crocodyli]|uniref:Transcriptional regulator n=1 Tax=Sphingomonas crocodyli TaxID=1979270 RepID=A0A437M0C6_9SPHN|nr:helix-turn-helix domain-containing protein [Sphingomonas crocodyli]RVT91098.1 transcriptional regulator [Sphingomonas crocodyli]
MLGQSVMNAGSDKDINEPRDARANSATKPRNTVKSGIRAVEVIDYFMQVAEPVRTATLSKALGIPNSSADELLRTLAASGYLNYDVEQKLYSPSYKLVSNIRAVERNFFGEDVVARMMSDLRSETGASVVLTQQNDCWMDSVARVTGSWIEQSERYPAELVCYQGDRWQPSTNFAAAILTRYSNVQLADLTQRIQRLGLGPSGPSLFDGLIGTVERTRSRGYAVFRGDEGNPVNSIAVPLVMRHAASPYAIGLIGPSLFASAGDEREVAQILRRITDRYIDRINGLA